MTLPAITVRPPWSALIAIGEKTVENRGRFTKLRGDIAIHAGKTPDLEALVDVSGKGIDGPFMVLGAVLAVAELTGCHEADQDSPETCCPPYGFRRYNGGPAYHLTFANIRRLPTPIECRGQLGVGWGLPTDVERAVRDQLPPLPEEA